MIKRVGPSKYVVMNAEGTKKLSRPLSKAGAVKRLKQVERMKAQKGY